MKVDKKIIKRQKVQKIWDFNCSKRILILLLFDNALVYTKATMIVTSGLMHRLTLNPIQLIHFLNSTLAT